jgi:hypothetical protein
MNELFKKHENFIEATTENEMTGRRLGHRVQILLTPSPYHLPHEVITPLGFFANMTP